jgi:hypothetical protein
MDTCVSIVEMVSHWNGTFALDTRVGDISGRASGLVTEVIPPDVRTVFNLIPRSGTRALGEKLVPLTLELVFNVPGPAVVAPANGTLTVGPA